MIFARSPIVAFSARQAGLTLIEVLVAVAVLAIIAVISYQSLNVTLDSNEVVDAKMQKLGRFDRAWVLLENDLGNALAQKKVQSVGAGSGSELEAVHVDSTDPRFLVVLRGGYANNLALANAGALRPEVVRVAYRLEDGVLWRDLWYNTSATDVEDSIQRKLLDDVERVEISALSAEATSYEAGPWLDAWANVEKIPLALKITLQVKDAPEFTRVFVLPGAL